MAGLNKSVSFRIVADAGVAREQLDAITAQADKLKAPIDLKLGAMGGQANTEIDKLKASLGSARDVAISFNDSLKGLGDESAKVAEIERGLAQADDVLAKSMQASLRATLALADADKTLADAEKMVSDGSIEQQAAMRQSTLRTNEQAAASGRFHSQMNMAALGIGIAAAASIKMAGDFQQSTNKLVTSAGETTKNIDMVRRGMYMVESAGFHGASGLTVLKAAAEGARAEQAPLATVTNAVTSALKSYHLGANDATRITNMMVAAVGHGKMTFESFAGSLSTVLPIASAAKLSFAEVGGAIATLTNHGTSADEATQELAHTIRALQAPNAVAVKEMGQLGISSNDVADKLGKRGLTGTIQMLEQTVLKNMGPAGDVLLKTFNQSKAASQDANTMLKALPSSIQGVAKGFLDGTITQKQWTTALKGMTPIQKAQAAEFATTAKNAFGFNAALRAGLPGSQTFTAAMGKMMGGATGLNTALMLGGENMGTFKANVAAVGEAGQKTGKDVNGWAEIQKTYNFRMAQGKDSAKAMAISFGTALLPAVTAIVKPLSEFAAFLAKSSAASTTFAVVVGGVLTAVIGTKMVQGFLAAKTAGEQLITGIGKLPALLGLQKVATEEATVAQDGLNVAESANPIGAIILGITLLVGAFIYLWTHVKGFRDFWKAVWKDIKIAFDDVFGFIKHNWALILGILTGPIGIAVLMIVKHWNTIKDGFITAWHDITGFFSTVWHWIVDGVSSMANGVVNFFVGLPGRIINGLGNIVQWMYNLGKNIVQGIINGIENAAGGVFSVLKNLASGAVNAVKSFLGINSPSKVFAELGMGIPEGLGVGIDQHAHLATNAVGRLSNSVTNAMQVPGGYGATGGNGGQTVNNFNITGMVTNPDQVARQIAQLLNDYNRHNGKAPVFA